MQLSVEKVDSRDRVTEFIKRTLDWIARARNCRDLIEKIECGDKLGKCREIFGEIHLNPAVLLPSKSAAVNAARMPGKSMAPITPVIGDFSLN